MLSDESIFIAYSKISSEIQFLYFDCKYVRAKIDANA